MKGALLLAASCLIAFFTGVMQAGAPQTEIPEISGSLIFEKPLPVSDFEFLDQFEQTRNKASLTGKWSLVFFGYTFCPDICPTTLADLGRVWKKLTPEQAKQWQVVFVSVDPDRDVSANMRTYLKYFHPDFLGLTGNPESLQQLATELNGYYSRAAYGKTGYLMDHSANMMLVDEQWNYRGFIEPPFTTERLLPLLQALPQIR